MFRPKLSLGILCLCLCALPGVAQTAPPTAASGEKNEKASAYYYYSLGHLYAELSGAYGNRQDYFNKAVENYRQAMKADPSASFISEELSELYLQSGRYRDAVTEAEETLKANPDDLGARRLLARIYTRLIGDSQANRVDENMVHKAIEQYSKIAEKDPKDTEAWLMLGRLNKLQQNSTEAQKAFQKALDSDPNNEDALTGLAMVQADLGDTKAATDLLRKAAEANPTPRSLTALANAYEQMKDYAQAATTLRRALDAAPGNADIQKALAQNLLFSDRLDEALKLYQEIASEDPKDVTAELRISQIYRQQHDFGKAREAAEKAKELEPNNIEIQYNEVNLLEAEGKPSEAIASLKGILKSTEKSSYAAPERNNRVLLLERLGFLYRSSGQYQAAVDEFRQIADLDTDAAPRAEAQIIETWRAAKDMRKAEAVAEAAVKKYPNDKVVRSVHASLLADTGRTDQAVAEIKALTGGKPDRDTYIALAQIYEKGKNFGEMGKALDEAEKLSLTKDDKVGIYFMRGAMYEREKDYDRAEAEFRKVLELDPDNGSALNYLGYMLADRNIRLPEAERLISKAVGHEPNNGAYLDSLGWVYYRMNKLDDAERQLRHALELMATDPTVHDHLGDVYFRQGKTREAIAQWQNSLQEWQSSPPSEQDGSEVAKVQKKLENAKTKLAQETGVKQP